MRVACIYFDQPQDTKGIAEIFYRATPQIMLAGDRGIFLEISKSGTLYSERTFLRRAAATLQRLGLKAEIAIAEDIPTSLAFAVYKSHRKMQLPIEALRFYADPFFVNVEASNNISKAILLFKQLGLETLEDFLKLSPRDILSRFGSLCLTVYLRVGSQSNITWQLFKPSEIVSEKHEFDMEYPVDNLEPVYFRLHAMLDRAILRLRGKGKRLKQFDIILRQEHFSETRDYKVSVLLQLPYISNKVIFQITKEKLDAQVMRKPFESRISEFTLVVTEEAPYFMNQKDLFNQKKEENEESFFQLVSRVATKLGRSAVFFAKPRESYLPEKNWERVEEMEKPTQIQDRLPERPLRIFSQPLQVEFLEDKILIDDHAEEIEFVGNKEVVFSDWWENPLERMYYRLLTKTGKHLWLYRTSQGHFLHGAFD